MFQVGGEEEKSIEQVFFFSSSLKIFYNFVLVGGLTSVLI